MDKVIKILEELGIPYAYDHFAEGESPPPPFICFLIPESNDFPADGKNYFRINRVHIELYTDRKNPELEGNLEYLLDKHSIFFTKSEVWIGSEQLYEVLYRFETEA